MHSGLRDLLLRASYVDLHSCSNLFLDVGLKCFFAIGYDSTRMDLRRGSTNLLWVWFTGEAYLFQMSRLFITRAQMHYMSKFASDHLRIIGRRDLLAVDTICFEWNNNQCRPSSSCLFHILAFGRGIKCFSNKKQAFLAALVEPTTPHAFTLRLLVHYKIKFNDPPTGNSAVGTSPSTSNGSTSKPTKPNTL